jgi:hypothetical protein
MTAVGPKRIPGLRRILDRMRRVARGLPEKPGAAERAKAWRDANPDRVRDYREARRDETNAAVNAKRADPSTLIGAKRAAREAARQDQSCKHCGETDTYRLEFVHRSGERKLANLSDMVIPACYTLSIFKAELAKCDIICASCRRVAAHAKRQAADAARRRKQFGEPTQKTLDEPAQPEQPATTTAVYEPGAE